MQSFGVKALSVGIERINIKHKRNDNHDVTYINVDKSKVDDKDELADTILYL